MNINKNHLNLVAYILIGLALIASLYLGGQRIAIEQNNDQVEVMVNYTELVSLARANNLEVGELALILKDQGLTGVLFKELSIGDLERNGQVGLYQGQEAKLAPYASKLSEDIALKDSNVIISIHNKELEGQIVEHLQHKFSGVAYYPGDISAIAIPINVPNSDTEKARIYRDIKDLGVGFIIPELEEMANLGITIIPQVRDWKKPTHSSLVFMAEEVKKLPNLSFIMFNDEQIPGFPDKFKSFADRLIVDGQVYAPIGVVEFFNQRGINTIAAYLNKEAVRVHSIPINEMPRYSPKTAIDRFELAVDERNIRALFVRFLDMEQPAGALEVNLAYFADLTARIEKAGFTIGQPVYQFESPTYSRILIALIGLGVIGGAVLVFNTKEWTLIALAKLVMGALAWLALLYISPILARKLAALASVIVFPTLAILLIVREKPRTIMESILALFKMSAISLIGAVLMIGLLADKLFMLKLDQFVGVKIAHALPLIFVLALMHKFEDHPVREAKKILTQPITYLVAGLGGVLAIALAFYIMRTGNVDADMVLGIEQRMRDGLNQILGVRPRTKEFLIGYPFTLLLLYLGVSKLNWPLLIPAVIGQVSLINTYAHIHTPIIISMIRSIHGLWIGIILGVVVIIGWRMVEKYISERV